MLVLLNVTYSFDNKIIRYCLLERLGSAFLGPITNYRSPKSWSANCRSLPITEWQGNRNLPDLLYINLDSRQASVSVPIDFFSLDHPWLKHVAQCGDQSLRKMGLNVNVMNDTEMCLHAYRCHYGTEMCAYRVLRKQNWSLNCLLCHHYSDPVKSWQCGAML